jgi:hypothetical protein
MPIITMSGGDPMNNKIISLRIPWVMIGIIFLGACQTGTPVIQNQIIPEVSVIEAAKGTSGPPKETADPEAGGMSILRAATSIPSVITSDPTKARIAISVSVNVINLPNKMNANLRSGPGEEYSIAGGVHLGSSLQATGITSDHQWLQINYPGGPNGKAWIYTRLTDYSPSLGDLQVIEIPHSKKTH